MSPPRGNHGDNEPNHNVGGVMIVHACEECGSLVRTSTRTTAWCGRCGIDMHPYTDGDDMPSDAVRALYARPSGPPKARSHPAVVGAGGSHSHTPEWQRSETPEPEYALATVSRLIGTPARTIRYWCAEGVIEARKRRGSWWIPEQELERLQAQIAYE